MKKLFKALLFCAGLTLAPFTSSYAWNALAHMAVAKIAYDNLTPAAAEKVNKMVASFQQEYPNIQTFVEMAPWADQLAWGQQIGLYTHWHYINNTFSTDGTPLKNISDTDNAGWAVVQLEKIVQNNQANPYERARALAFLVHIVGDLHQPLHTVARLSAAHPDGDQGGNLFSVRLPLTHPKSKSSSVNLHSFWDSGLGAFEGNSDQAAVTRLATSLTATYSSQYFNDQAQNIESGVWINESEQLAVSFVYSTPENQIPSAEYMSQGSELAKQRVALAGYRLAALLNHLLG